MNDGISYELKDMPMNRTTIIVRLGRKIVGEIRRVEGGYAYHPKGGQPGDTFSTIAAVKRSIED